MLYHIMPSLEAFEEWLYWCMYRCLSYLCVFSSFVCLCVYVFICWYIYVYVFIRMCMRLFECLFSRVCVICVWLCVNVSTWVYMCRLTITLFIHSLLWDLVKTCRRFSLRGEAGLVRQPPPAARVGPAGDDNTLYVYMYMYKYTNMYV